MQPRFVLTTSAISLAFCLASCSSDYKPDESFTWGSGSQFAAQTGFAEGWIGGAADGWHQYSGAPFSLNTSSFYQPADVYVSNNGHIYTADSGNHRVCRWDASGVFEGWIGGGVSGWNATYGPGGSGADSNSFNEPSGVCLDSSGNIYVADKQNNRVCKWDGFGQFQGWIGGGATGWQGNTAPPSGNGQAWFIWPVGLWIDGGMIYVADSNNHRISRWDLQGNPQGWIGGSVDGWQSAAGAWTGSDVRSFNFPMDVCAGQDGYLYVADMMNNRISRWNIASGAAAGWVGGGFDGWQMTGQSLSPTDMSGHFNMPAGIFAAGANLFVSDRGNNRIHAWGTDGKVTGWIGGGSDGWKNYYGAAQSSDMRSFFEPQGIFMSRSSRIYAADVRNNRISRWSNAPSSSDDTIPPAQITDLSATPQGTGSVSLSWTATGDDGWTWQASGYEIRFSYSPIISDADFSSAMEYPQNIHPNAPGSPETFMLNGLNPGQQCWFAIRILDEFYNRSPWIAVGPVTVPAA